MSGFIEVKNGHIGISQNRKYSLASLISKIALVALFPFSIALSASNIPEAGFADLVDNLAPAVVNISTKQVVSIKRPGEREYFPFPKGSPFNEMDKLWRKFGFPFDMDNEELFAPKSYTSLGSGFIIDRDGYIVTNNHVIANAEEIEVRLNSGEELKAKIIGRDPQTDLALLKVNAKKPLPIVKFGDSDKIRVGNLALAIGNPFGLGGTVTFGIISAHARDINLGSIINEYIQTDAPINRGSSGSPLFNMQGEVIGINTAIASSSYVGGNVGIGFAIPSSIAAPVIEQLRKGIKIQRGWIGVFVQNITEEMAVSLNMKEKEGVLVREVMKSSPAEKAGIKPGDVILKVGDKRIANISKLMQTVAITPPNKTVDILLWNIKATRTVSVKVSEFPEEVTASYGSIKEKDDIDKADSQEIEGAKIATLTSDLRKKYDIAKDINGLLVLNVKKDSEWAMLGIEPGDVIVQANQEDVTSPEDLKKLIKKHQSESKKYLSLLINRQGNIIFMTLSIYNK